MTPGGWVRNPPPTALKTLKTTSTPPLSSALSDLGGWPTTSAPAGHLTGLLVSLLCPFSLPSTSPRLTLLHLRSGRTTSPKASRPICRRGCRAQVPPSRRDGATLPLPGLVAGFAEVGKHHLRLARSRSSLRIFVKEHPAFSPLVGVHLHSVVAAALGTPEVQDRGRRIMGGTQRWATHTGRGTWAWWQAGRQQQRCC